MFDIGWSELLLIGVVALIVVGPKDLPKMFHQLGRITAKAKSMAREFSRAMEDAAKDTGLDDAAKSVRDLKSVASKKSLGLDALEKAADTFEKWEPRVPDRKADALEPDPEAAPPRPEASEPASAAPEVAEPAPKPARKTATKTGTAKAKTSKTATAKSGGTKTAAARTGAGKSAAKKPAPKKGDA